MLIGSIAGHLICTATAVLGGSFVAKHLSVRKGNLYSFKGAKSLVTLSGAVLFFIFFAASVWEIALESLSAV